MKKLFAVASLIVISAAFISFAASSKSTEATQEKQSNVNQASPTNAPADGFVSMKVRK